MRARLLALRSLMTGSMLKAGDSPIADVKTQTIDTSTNVGLMSALVLTIVVPIMFDAAPGAQTNSYMITNPEWVGTCYFAFGAVAAWLFAISTIFAILTILVVNETYSTVESQSLVIAAQAQFLRPIQYFVMGWSSMVFMLILWLAIISFDLAAVDECDKEVSEPSSGPDTGITCDRYPVTFGVTLLSINIVSVHAVHSAVEVTPSLACRHVHASSMTCSMLHDSIVVVLCLKLIAKLYKCKHMVTRRLKANQASKSKQLPEHAQWLYEPRAEEIWEKLCEYRNVMGKACSPDGFKDYLVLHRNAAGLSYLAGQLVEKLYAEKVRQELAEDHIELVRKLAAGHLSKALTTYPIGTDLHGNVDNATALLST